MASPYALDWSPLTNALDSNQQNEFQRNRLAMEQRRLGMAEESHDWERKLQPIKFEAAKLSNETAKQQGLLNVGRIYGAMADDILADKDPVSKQAKLDRMLANPAVRDYFGGHFPAGYEKNPDMVAGFLSKIGKDPTAEEKAKLELESLRGEVEATKRFRGATEAPSAAPPSAVRGYGADPGRGAIAPGSAPEVPAAKLMTPEDERMWGEANPGKWYSRWDGKILRAPGGATVAAAPAPIPVASPGAAGARERPGLAPATPSAPVVPSSPPAGGEEPLRNLASELIRLQGLMRTAPKSAWPMIEKEMDRINKEIEKGVTISRTGRIINAPGAPEAEATKAAAVEQAKKIADARGTAITNLPDAERALSTMLGKILAVEKHPALSNVIGPFDRWTPTLYDDSRDVEAKIGELQGATFMQAFTALRGAGQITEKEGEKATAALNRLSEKGVSEKQYVQALKDFRKEVISLYNLAQQRAGAPKPPPQVGEIRMGAGNVPYIYKGGPLNDPNSYEAIKD